MKTLMRGSMVTVICGAALLTGSGARANDIEDFFKRAHRSLVKRHKEIARAHVSAAAAVASTAPKLRCVSVTVGHPRGYAVPRRHHVCRKIRVRIWVPGYWEETVEQQWVPYRYRRGGYYQDVVVKHWVPGYYKYVWQVDPNCSCRRPARGCHGSSHHSRPGHHERHDRNGCCGRDGKRSGGHTSGHRR